MSRFLQSAACVLVAFVLCCGVLFLWLRYSLSQSLAEAERRVQEVVAKNSDADSVSPSGLWPIVLDHAKTVKILHQETSSPVVMKMKLSEDPYSWSKAMAVRPHGEGIDKSTIVIELAMFVSDLPWFPIKDVSNDLLRFRNGKSDLIEWECTSEETDTQSERTIRFRLLAQ